VQAWVEQEGFVVEASIPLPGSVDGVVVVARRGWVFHVEHFLGWWGRAWGLPLVFDAAGCSRGPAWGENARGCPRCDRWRFL